MHPCFYLWRTLNFPRVFLISLTDYSGDVIADARFPMAHSSSNMKNNLSLRALSAKYRIDAAIRVVFYKKKYLC